MIQRTLLVIATAAAAVVVARPAAAQVFWGDSDRSYRDRYHDNYNNNYQHRDFFFPFSGFMRPPPVVDSTKAPPPRKLETPPTTSIIVVGDSLADWLCYGLDELYADQTDMGVERKIRPTSGLIRYDPKNENLDWSQAIKDALANEKPNAIVVMLGLNDRLPLRDKAPPPPAAKRPGEPASGPNQTTGQGANAAANAGTNQGTNQTSQAANQPDKDKQDKAAAPADSEAPPQNAAQSDAQHLAPGSSYDFHTDQWATLYGKRIDEMIAALKAKGVPILWVGLPAIRGTKSTSDLSYLDELYREHAEKAGIDYVDIWDGFVDDQGRFALQGPDFEGQTRRLRTSDGVHFTKAGAVKLASYVDRDLRRALSNHVVPVALPGPEAAPKAATTGAKPDAGPVLPLSIGGGETGDLAGGGNRPAQTSSDPIATKVLSRGDSVSAPAGRADDFSWPRPASNASAAPEASPQPVASTPATPTKQGDAGKKPAESGKEANKDASKDSNKDANKDTKNKAVKDPAAAPVKPRRAPNAILDGAPIPPAPVGSR
ncbi:MAG: GDSL-type esterase/lipase family protein [Xanthobacteraceae bacterium]